MNRRGVLGLVHQNVVDAAVQPVQHPVRNAGIVQQRLRAGDQIVKVQPAAQGLFALVGGQEPPCKAVQMQVALCRLKRQPLVACVKDPFGQRIELRK